MNKKELTEADIRTKFITPALVGPDGGKWNLMTQLREEIYFTKGRIALMQAPFAVKGRGLFVVEPLSWRLRMVNGDET